MVTSLAGPPRTRCAGTTSAACSACCMCNGATSRSDLTALTGLNRSTIGALTTELADAGLVTGAGPGGPRRSRPPLDHGRPGHRAGLRAGARRRRRPPDRRRASGWAGRCSTAARSASRGATTRPAGSCGTSSGWPVRARRRRRRLGLRGHRRRGAAASSRTPTAWCASRPTSGWVDVPFGALLAERLSTALPVAVGNDADLGAIAEHVRGAARGVGQRDLPVRRGRGRRRDHPGRPADERGRRLRRRGRAHGGQPARAAVPLRRARLLGDRGRRGRRRCSPPDGPDATIQEVWRAARGRGPAGQGGAAPGRPLARASAWRTWSTCSTPRSSCSGVCSAGAARRPRTSSRAGCGWRWRRRASRSAWRCPSWAATPPCWARPRSPFARAAGRPVGHAGPRLATPSPAEACRRAGPAA